MIIFLQRETTILTFCLLSPVYLVSSLFGNGVYTKLKEFASQGKTLIARDAKNICYIVKSLACVGIPLCHISVKGHSIYH